MISAAESILTDDQLGKATLCNKFYSFHNPEYFEHSQFADLTPGSVGCATAIGRWQRDHGLYIDGILGPKTAASLEGREWRSPKGENYFIIKGEKLPTPFPVIHWTHPQGLSYARVIEAMPNFGGVSRRADPSVDTIERFVLHWDECVSSHDCFHVTFWRGLSIQLCLDSDGTLYQCMDLVDDLARHARWTNETSIGVEICNPVSLRQGYGVRNRKIVQAQEPHTGDPTWRHFDFTHEQKKMAAMAIPALCDALKIPRKLPRDETGEVPKGLVPDPTCYEGVLGHYHLQTDKVDPGYTLWPLLLNVL